MGHLVGVGGSSLETDHTGISVKQLPYELREQVTIYFEEGLHAQGIDLLTSLLTSGLACSGYALLPDSSHLALILTLTVHPAFTTRAKDQSATNISILAHRYLELINKLVGPLPAHLSEAYIWPDHTTTRRGATMRRRREGSDSPTKDGYEGMRSEYASSKAIYNCSSDFWVVVGWALNCSIAHPQRWFGAWEQWLGYMTTVLEQDWAARKSEEEQLKSLLVKYVRGTDQRPKILRAIFADDGDKSAAEFKAVWRNETSQITAESKHKTKYRRQDVDLEAEKFGDYLDISSDDGIDAEEGIGKGGPNDRSGEDRQVQSESTALLGGYSATCLRIRLLALLVSLSETLPEHFGNIWNLVDSCVAYIRPLPLTTFSVVMSPTTLEPFSPSATLTFIKFTTHTLIQSGARPTKQPGLDQQSLIDCYLPFTANTNTIVDNARISICIEGLMRFLDLQGELHWSEELEAALEEGIEKRDSKATRAKASKGEAMGEGDEDADRAAMNDSAMRMRLLLETRKLAAATPQPG